MGWHNGSHDSNAGGGYNLRKLVLADIRPIDAYLQERDQFRRSIIALKKRRRIALGPRCSLVFESFDTMRFQVQEMARIEHIVAAEALQQELDCYNDLLPDGLAIGATFLIELQQGEDIPAILKDLSGVEETLTLTFGDRCIAGEAEPGRSTDEKTSSVHYLTFRFLPEDRQRLSEASAVTLRTEHPHYRHAATLSREAVASLVEDLRQA